jgi:prephenate dehydrogenase
MRGDVLPFAEVVIIGAKGSVGSLFCAALAADGRRIVTIDLQRSGESQEHADYFSCDVRNPDAAVQRALGAAELVILAVPERVALEAWPKISALLGARTLLVDTLSVKSRFAELVHHAHAQAEVLSINPMFAPSLGFAGNNAAAVPLVDGPQTKAFIELLESWGCRVQLVSAEEHDRTTAAVQVATHAAILTFGASLMRLGYDARQAAALMTPPHRSMLALLERIATANPEVYWEIQAENPFAASARAALSSGLSDLARWVDQGDYAAFQTFLRGLKSSVLPSSGGDRKQP